MGETILEKNQSRKTVTLSKGKARINFKVGHVLKTRQEITRGGIPIKNKLILGGGGRERKGNLL